MFLLLSPLKINCIHHFHAQLPFGGYKHPDIGREMGDRDTVGEVEL
jgi:hypothetical protein